MEPDPLDAGGPTLERLRADHRALLEAVDTLEREVATPAPTLRAIADRLAAEYASHVIEEDGVILPLLERQLPDGSVTTEGLRQDHAELGAMLDAFRESLGLPASRERDEQLRVQAQDFAALLRSQLRKEETLVFAIAGRQATRDRTQSPPGGRS